MQSPDFQLIAAYYEQELVSSLLNSKPEDSKSREQIFFRIQGFRDFLIRLASTAEMKQKLINPVQDQSDIDDPTVHNIYEGIFD